MESFTHLRKGTTPRRVHADLDGLKDDELGRGGFTGRTANLYRRNDPTHFRATGPLRPIGVLSSELKPDDATDASGAPLLMFSNADCRISLSKRSQPMPFYVRYVDGDLLCFVHEGAGRLETEFGPMSYRAGDWIYLPKATTWRQLPSSGTDPAASTWLMIEATDEFRVPPAGPLGRHWPFDPAQAVVPDPAALDDDGRDEYEVRLYHRPVDGIESTTLRYPHHPLDVEGWRGDNYAFTFNIADYNVITSDSVHLPPMVHLFMAATGVYVCNFLPKPAESVPGTERTPWYHRNVDFDEIAFFHGGSLYGIPMPPGLISHAPQGVHHGAPEKARERARRTFDEYHSVDWQVIAVDTRRRLTPSAEVLANDLEAAVAATSDQGQH
ncbi:homogentisate 1,2-dioxygenase [Mycolicibacterium sp. CBM1]